MSGVNFQYPHSDRKLCNISAQEKKIRSSEATFSIPIRIVSSATSMRPAFESSYLSFQYPHSDRKLCNRRPLKSMYVCVYTFLLCEAVVLGSQRVGFGHGYTHKYTR